ncbi:MAG: family 16 glycoside hydrolase [Planctomycetales bacterium]
MCCCVTGVRAENGHDGFETLFDGQRCEGGISKLPRRGTKGREQADVGRKWVIEKGAIVGSRRDIPGNGGIIITDEQFGDFEVVLEMNNDFGPDSGPGPRGAREDGKAWQAMIDYHSNGNVMGIYGEGLGGKPSTSGTTTSRIPREDPGDHFAGEAVAAGAAERLGIFHGTASGTNCGRGLWEIRPILRRGSTG